MVLGTCPHGPPQKKGVFQLFVVGRRGGHGSRTVHRSSVGFERIRSSPGPSLCQGGGQNGSVMNNSGVVIYWMGVEQRRDSSSKETRNVIVLDGEPILSVEEFSDHQEDSPRVRIWSQFVIGLGVERPEPARHGPGRLMRSVLNGV